MNARRAPVRVLCLALALGLAAPAALAAPPAQKPAAQPVQTVQATQAETRDMPDPRRTPVVRVVQEASPAVVSIVSARTDLTPFAGNNPFQRFFGELNGAPQQKKSQSQNLGSGVIIDGRRAYVLTNAHVIAGATQITARLMDGREFSASLLGADPDMDLAVLRLEVKPGQPALPQARMGDSAELLIGETVVAIGNPFGLSHTVTTGVVSAVDRSVRTQQQTITGLIQTDAAINPGNSGGPLLNLLGQVVGINAAVFAKGGGIGFAIPINRARRVLDELIATGRVAHLWLGLLGENMTPDQTGYFGLAKLGGMVVTDVFPGTPAEAAGIKPGDALMAIGGRKVRDKAQFLSLLLGYARGDVLDVLLHRGREPFTVKMRPQALDREAGLGLIDWRWGFLPAPEAAGAPSPPGAAQAGAAQAGGLVVGVVRENGPAARLGLKPGDLLLQVGSLRTQKEAELLTAFTRYQMHNTLLLSVQRGGQVYTVRMKI